MRPNKRDRRYLELLVVETVNVNNELEVPHHVSVNPISLPKKSTATAVVEMSEDVDQNIYCKILQQFLDVSEGATNSPKGTTYQIKIRNNGSIDCNEIPAFNQRITGIVDLRNDESKIPNTHSSILFADQS